MNVEDLVQVHPAAPAQNLDVISACVKACYACSESCTLCADACLGETQLEMLRRCARLTLDCAAICAVTGQVVARQTETVAEVLRKQLESCITACRVCREECQRHANEHGHCRLCAQSCQFCEKACIDLLGVLQR
ncbi:MAG: four-helix bundle copper-binding protein [Candidatus Competibacteraceae bacterium]